MRLSETPTQIKMERNSTVRRTCRWVATLCISDPAMGSALKVANGNTGVNISHVTVASSWPVTGGELTGAVGAGASTGSAQQHDAAPGAQHFIWQTGFASARTGIAADITCAIRKKAAKASLIQGRFMLMWIMTVSMSGATAFGGPRHLKWLPVRHYFFTAVFTWAANLAGSLLKSFRQDLQHRYTSVPSCVTLKGLPMPPRSSPETTHFLSG